MAVKLHGIRGGSSPVGGAWPGAAPPPGGAGVVSHRAPAALPGRTAPAAPRKMRPPLTLGRLLYFAILAGAMLAGGYYLWLHLFFARAVGVFERDVEQLAPREAGRILRVAVQPGDAVKKGQPLVWLDYGADAADSSSSAESGYLSAHGARAAAERQRRQELQQRRHEIEERRALLRGDIASLRARAQGLELQRDMVARSQEVAARLQKSGAATVAEVLRLQQQLAALDQERAAAQADGRQKERAEHALDEEAAQLDRTLKGLSEAPPHEDPGLITAPRDGVVAWVAHRAGEVVGPSDAVVTLRGGPLRVRAYVAPRDVMSLGAGRDVRVELPTGEALQGQVARQHQLATSVEEGRGAAARDPALAAEPVMPFVVADVDLPGLDPALAERLPLGSPCEIYGVRQWLRSARELWRRR